MHKRLIITPELALTLQLLENEEIGMFVTALIEYAGGERGIEPSDFPRFCAIALIYWFAHIDDITITVED